MAGEFLRDDEILVDRVRLGDEPVAQRVEGRVDPDGVQGTAACLGRARANQQDDMSNMLEDVLLLHLLLAWFVVWARLGYLAGRSQGRALVGTVLGVVLGFIGIGITVLLPRKGQLARDDRRRRSEREMESWLATHGESLSHSDDPDDF